MSEEDEESEWEEETEKGKEKEEEEESEDEVDIEGELEHALDVKKVDERMKLLLDVIKLEKQQEKKNGKFGFRALCGLVKIYYDKNDWALVKKNVDELLSYVSKKAIVQQVSNNELPGLFEYISKIKNENLVSIFESALSVLENAKYNNSFLKTKEKYAAYLYQSGNLANAEKHCLELLNLVDKSKGEEIGPSSILMQVYGSQSNYSKLREVYNTISSSLKNSNDTKNIALISEYGGRLYLNSENFDAACVDFSRAFRNYEKIVLKDKSNLISSLRCIMLTSMLSRKTSLHNIQAVLSDVQKYTSEEDIGVLTELAKAFISCDLDGFENVLNDKAKEKALGIDPLVKRWMGEIVRVLKMKILAKVIAPFSVVTLSYLAEQLHADELYVESLLALLIVDGTVLGNVDQVKKVFYAQEHSVSLSESEQYSTWREWAQDLHNTVASVVYARRLE